MLRCMLALLPAVLAVGPAPPDWRTHYPSPEEQSSRSMWGTLSRHDYAGTLSNASAARDFWQVGVQVEPRHSVLSVDDLRQRYGIGLRASERSYPMGAVFLDPPDGDPSPCSILIAAAYHAREPATTLVAMKVLQRLTGGDLWGNDTYAPLRACRLTIVWNANIGGYVKLWQSASGAEMWRKNARGVDLNRNFPVKESGEGEAHKEALVYEEESQQYAGEYAGSEVETRLLMELGREREFSVGLCLHSWGDLVYMGTSATEVAEGELLAHEMVKRGVPFLARFSSKVGTHAQYISESREGSVGITIELFRTFIPTRVQLKQGVASYAEGLLEYCVRHAERHARAPTVRERRSFVREGTAVGEPLSHPAIWRLAAASQIPRQNCPIACQRYASQNLFMILRHRYRRLFLSGNSFEDVALGVDCASGPVPLRVWTARMRSELGALTTAAWGARVYRWASSGPWVPSADEIWLQVRWMLREVGPLILVYRISHVDPVGGVEFRDNVKNEAHAVVLYGQRCDVGGCRYDTLNNGEEVSVPKDSSQLSTGTFILLRPE